MMMMTFNLFKKSNKNGKNIYKYNDKIVPSVTTILDYFGDKTGLMGWANNLGRNGIILKQEQDRITNIGTNVHNYIENYLINKFNLDEEIRSINTSIKDTIYFQYCKLNFLNWINNIYDKGIEFEPIFIEKSFISEKYLYAGTCDLYCKLNGKYTIIDFKTSNRYHMVMHFQLAAYRQLLEENGHRVDRLKILRLDKNKVMSKVKTYRIRDGNKYFKQFIKMIDIYYFYKNNEPNFK